MLLQVAVLCVAAELLQQINEGGLLLLREALQCPVHELDHDGDELGRGSNPTARDSDGDGLSDGFEAGQGTSPTSIDSDGDGVDDGYETGRGMNPLGADSDGDGVADGDELYTYGTNPLNPDSDGDEHSDGQEINCGQDPNTFTDYTDVVSC